MAALGLETSSGDFEVIDICFAGMPDLVKPSAGLAPSGTAKGKEKAEEDGDGQYHAPTCTHLMLDTTSDAKTWVAIASGLSVGSQEAPADLKVQLLAEWLMGEMGGASVNRSWLACQAIQLTPGPNRRLKDIKIDPSWQYPYGASPWRGRQEANALQLKQTAIHIQPNSNAVHHSIRSPLHVSADQPSTWPERSSRSDVTTTTSPQSHVRQSQEHRRNGV